MAVGGTLAAGEIGNATVTFADAKTAALASVAISDSIDGVKLVFAAKNGVPEKVIPVQADVVQFIRKFPQVMGVSSGRDSMTVVLDPSDLSSHNFGSFLRNSMVASPSAGAPARQAHVVFSLPV